MLTGIAKRQVCNVVEDLKKEIDRVKKGESAEADTGQATSHLTDAWTFVNAFCFQFCLCPRLVPAQPLKYASITLHTIMS